MGGRLHLGRGCDYWAEREITPWMWRGYWVERGYTLEGEWVTVRVERGENID